MIEIERKFLVKSNNFKDEATSQIKIKQGYLNKDPERTVRIRVTNEKAFITIKGKSSEDGMSRFEWEKEININEAEKLLELCTANLIEKIRYEVNFGNHTFVVDEFFGAQKGLILAEIELTSPDEKFDNPNWLGDEVTGVSKYYNAMM